ncbi:helix-turn-helix transcriptional regulator [Fusobacterium ulcerans]|uniref:helix-turn-helix transcriptional regulator n=1 Tax=Fusobacterium ulcerans TaxID=861 RepID=UPI0026ECAC56|nr:helix-turn-helix domain-containing protein [Fusobacterium ulcerans]
MKYYNFIKDKRKILGYSTRELGEKVGVSGSYISMIENDKISNPPSEEVLRKLCIELKFTDEEIKKFYELLDTDLLPERVIKQIKELKKEISNHKKKISPLEYELHKEFEGLNDEQKEKVLKFIREFIK